MFSRNSNERMKLGPSLKRYWPFFLGMTLFHALVVFVPSVSANHAVVITLFFAAAIPASWPYVCGNAPYSFWMVACGYWFFGLILMAMIKVLIMFFSM